MSRSKETFNLFKYIIDPLNEKLGKRLETFTYHDVFKVDELTTNYKGVDIISHQLELKLEGESPIFISWATIDGWYQYSLCISETSLNEGPESYIKQDEFWKGIIGKTLESFEIYGYTENVIISTESLTGKSTEKIYRYEPHLVILCFENDKVLGVANFYLDNDFLPKLPMGDDVWIIFDIDNINRYINKLKLEKLVV